VTRAVFDLGSVAAIDFATRNLAPVRGRSGDDA